MKTQEMHSAVIVIYRCGKIILLMSPAFLKSPECEFQMNVALKLSVGEKVRPSLSRTIQSTKIIIFFGCLTLIKHLIALLFVIL